MHVSNHYGILSYLPAYLIAQYRGTKEQEKKNSIFVMLILVIFELITRERKSTLRRKMKEFMISNFLRLF